MRYLLLFPSIGQPIRIVPQFLISKNQHVFHCQYFLLNSIDLLFEFRVDRAFHWKWAIVFVEDPPPSKKSDEFLYLWNQVKSFLFVRTYANGIVVFELLKNVLQSDPHRTLTSPTFFISQYVSNQKYRRNKSRFPKKLHFSSPLFQKRSVSYQNPNWNESASYQTQKIRNKLDKKSSFLTSKCFWLFS